MLRLQRCLVLCRASAGMRAGWRPLGLRWSTTEAQEAESAKSEQAVGTETAVPEGAAPVKTEEDETVLAEWRKKLKKGADREAPMLTERTTKWLSTHVDGEAKVTPEFVRSLVEHLLMDGTKGKRGRANRGEIQKLEFNQWKGDAVWSYLGVQAPLPELSEGHAHMHPEQVAKFLGNLKSYVNSKAYTRLESSAAKAEEVLGRWLTESAASYPNLLKHTDVQFTGRQAQGHISLCVGSSQRNPVIAMLAGLPVHTGEVDRRVPECFLMLRTMAEWNAYYGKFVAPYHGVVSDGLEFVFIKYDPNTGAYFQSEKHIMKDVNDIVTAEVVMTSLNTQMEETSIGILRYKRGRESMLQQMVSTDQIKVYLQSD